MPVPVGGGLTRVRLPEGGPELAGELLGWKVDSRSVNLSRTSQGCVSFPSTGTPSFSMWMGGRSIVERSGVDAMMLLTSATLIVCSPITSA
eukprot:1705126-Rhodomonas_salina.2